MRTDKLLRDRMRRARFEVFEERLALSAQPLSDPLTSPTNDFRLEHHYGDLTAVSELIRGDFIWEQPGGDVFHHDIEVTPQLNDSHGLTGLHQVRSDYGFSGRGQTVAIIDSGIAYDHVALGGGFGNGYRVVGGWDFAENDANPYDDGPAGFHGTHVAGIVGSTHVTYKGIAPGVDLVALRVFDDSGSGYFSWTEQALRWVHQNRNSFANPITTVNLSIGSTWNSNTPPNWAMLEDEFAQLKADGMFISVSAGNSFTSYNTPGVSYPAASPHVVPVASVDNNGNLSYFSQRNSRVIAAPGRSIISTVPDYVLGADGVHNDFASASGTSMAAPYLSGAAALVRQAMQFAGFSGVAQDTIYNHLRNTADVIYDTATNAHYYRLQLQRAIDTLMPADDYGNTAVAAHSLGTIHGTHTIQGTIGRLNDVDYFTFTAGQTGRVTMTATVTGEATLAGQLSQGTADASHNRLSFPVTAGQTYTTAWSSPTGLGHYQIMTNLEPVALRGPGLNVQVNSASDVVLNWGDVTGENGYRLYRRVDHGTPELIGQVGANETTFNCGGLVTGHTYEFQVVAFNSFGAAGGRWQSVHWSSPRGPGLTVEAISRNTVQLSWADTSNEDGYLVYRRANQGRADLVATLSADTTNWIATDLDTSDSHTFQIVAFNRLGVAGGQWQGSAPSGPGLVTSTLSATSTALHWSDVANETGYRIYRRSDGQAPVLLATLGANVSTYRVDGLATQSSHEFQVVAFNERGEAGGRWTNSVPSGPGLWTTSLSATETLLTWNNVANESGYRIYQRFNGHTPQVVGEVAANTTSLRVQTSRSDGQYEYQAVAFNAQGEAGGQWRRVVPVGPGLSIQSVSSSEISLTWNDVANESGYRVFRHQASGSPQLIATLQANTQSLSLLGSQFSSGDSFQIVAYNDAGEAGGRWVTVPSASPSATLASHLTTNIVHREMAPEAMSGWQAGSARHVHAQESASDRRGEDAATRRQIATVNSHSISPSPASSIHVRVYEELGVHQPYATRDTARAASHSSGDWSWLRHAREEAEAADEVFASAALWQTP